MFARFRPPLFADEIGQPYCVKFIDNSVIIQHDKLKRTMQFDFDGAMPPETTQAEVYQRVGAKLLNDVLSGYNCTLMTYGQTGSGKSFTMEGKNFKDLPDLKEGEELDPMSGVVPRLIEDIFNRLLTEQKTNPEFSFTVSASYVEVYRGDLVDCLIPKEGAAAAGWGAGDGSGGGKPSKVEVRFPDAAAKATPRLCGHTVVSVSDKAALRKVYQKGCGGRVVEATNANPVSSRGHGIFDINITQVLGLASTRTSLFRIVDLAGSEQAENTGQDAARQREAKAINTSLAMLGGVVLGLSQNEAFINYRRDILTRVLEESLGKGNKAILVVTGKPTMNNVKSTLNSLRFASTASFVQGDFFKNEKQTYAQLERGIFDRDALLKAKDDEIRELQDKMSKLLSDFAAGGKGESGEDTAKLKEALQELQGALREAQSRGTVETIRLEAHESRSSTSSNSSSGTSRNSANGQTSGTSVKSTPSKSRGGLSSSTGGTSIGDEERGSGADERASDLLPEKPVVPVIPPEAISAYSHSETQLLDDLKQACSPQPASYEADDMLKLYDKIPEHVSEALTESPPDLPAQARDGHMHRSGNLLMSGMLSVLIDKNNTSWPPKPVCPPGAFTVCPKCRNTNVKSASECAFCEKITSHGTPSSKNNKPNSSNKLGRDSFSSPRRISTTKLPLFPSSLASSPASPASPSASASAAAAAIFSASPASAVEDGKDDVTHIPDAHNVADPPPVVVKTPGSLPPKRPSMILLPKIDSMNSNGLASPSAAPVRGWIPAYFEVSIELQSLLVFHRKTGPQLGDTVRVKTNSGERTGVIRYIGRTGFAEGEWMGLELPDEKGKNDGTVKGQKYFECAPLHGLFVQPNSIIEHIDGKGSWELCASLPLVHTSIQPLTKDDYEFFPLTFSLHTSGSSPWVFRAFTNEAYNRWLRMLVDYASIWSEQEYRIQQVRSSQDATTFVSGMLRLLRADGAGWQKLFCQVRTEEGIFECFDLEDLSDVDPKDPEAVAQGFKTTPVCLCPILTCDASRVAYEAEGPKRHVFMLKPQWVWKQDSSPRVERTQSGLIDSSLSPPESKPRSMSFFSRPGSKSIAATATRGDRNLSVNSKGDGRGDKSQDSACLLLMADTERELDRWVENLKLLQQFKASSVTSPEKSPSSRRRGSLMVADSKLEGHMRSKHSKVFASWHPCYCVLTQTGQLQIYQAKHKGAGQVYLIGSMIITEVHIAKDKTKGFIMQPKGGDAKDGFMLGCIDPSEHQMWVDALVGPRDRT